MGILSRADILLAPLITTFVIGFIVIILFIWYSSQKQKYWKERNIPFVKPLPVFGTVLDSLKYPVQEIEQKRYLKLGRIYGHYEGNTAVLSVAEPEIIRKILVKDFQAFSTRRRFDGKDSIEGSMLSILRGEDWKRVRTIVSPTFTTGKIKRMLSIFKDSSKTLVENFWNFAEKDEPVEVKSIFGAYSMDIIASSAFSTKIDSHNDPNNEFVSAAKGMLKISFSWRFLLLLLFPEVIKLLRIQVFNLKGMTFFRNATLQIMEERKRTGQVRNDFLQLLLDSAKEVSQDGNLDVTDKDSEDILQNYGSQDENDQSFKYISSKKSLSVNELIAQCIIFFVAGYETTGSTLAFASYLLALHPNIQEKLIEEIDNALEENNGELTYESIQRMKYLDNVISETLRLYPPAVRLERTAEEEYKLGDTGITIPAGMLITIPIYAMQRDPEFFPDPEKFDPDRFNPEERAKRDPYTYMPFGSGPRNCVAMRFALMEIKVCLVYVIMNFRIKRCPETQVPLEFLVGQGLLQPKAIIVKMEKRKDAIKAP